MDAEYNVEITTIKITDIVPARYNPRKISNNEYNKLSYSINEYGLVDPIIIHLTNNHIIGGHQRYDVLMEEYMNGNNNYEVLLLIKRGDIGWAFPDETLHVKDLNHEKSLNLILNKVQGEWDLDKIEDLFNDLSVEGLDLKLTGFDKQEVKDLFKNVDVSGFGEELEDPFQDEEGVEKIDASHTEVREKHFVCPDCGYEWTESK